MPSDRTCMAAAAVSKTRAQRLRWPLMSLAVIAVVGGGAYFYFTGGRYQRTDDAYAQAATVSISANVAGRVSEIDIRDNEFVHRSATLFRLDDAPFRIAVSDAAARLADTRLQIESLKSTYRQQSTKLSFRAASEILKLLRAAAIRSTVPAPHFRSRVAGAVRSGRARARCGAATSCQRPAADRRGAGQSGR